MSKRKKLNFDQDDQDQCTKRQNVINKLFLKFNKEKTKNVQKQINYAFQQYYMFLNQEYTSPEKWQWYKNKKAQFIQLKNQITTQNQVQNYKNFITVQDVHNLRDKNNQVMKKVQKDLYDAIQITQVIKLNLNQKIQKLDAVYEENKDTKERLKRSLKGLRTMMRNIMKSKMTTFLSVITVIAILALIIFYILKQNGIIG